MTDRSRRRYATSTATWCQALNGYADPDRCTRDRKAHVHYDVCLDQDGRVLFRYWPIGTTWESPEGTRYRISGYSSRIDDLIRDGVDAETVVPVRPRYDGWTAGGGAFTHDGDLPEGSRLVEYALDHEGGRPLVGSLFVTGNGVAYRLRGYAHDWMANDVDATYPDWVVTVPAGGSSSAQGDLPADARLVWTP